MHLRDTDTVIYKVTHHFSRIEGLRIENWTTPA